MLVNSCAASARPPREDDRHQIVGAEVPLDEAARGGLDELRPQRVHVEVVEDHHVDATFERALVGLDIRLDRRLAVQRPVGPLDRDVHEREGRNGLRLPVLEDLKVVLRQVADEAALLVGDEGVHLDVFDLHLERGGLKVWGRSLCGLARSGLSGETGAGQRQQEPGQCEASHDGSHP